MEKLKASWKAMSVMAGGAPNGALWTAAVDSRIKAYDKIATVLVTQAASIDPDELMANIHFLDEVTSIPVNQYQEGLTLSHFPWVVCIEWKYDTKTLALSL